MSKNQGPNQQSIKVETPSENGVEKHIENVVESSDEKVVEPEIVVEKEKTIEKTEKETPKSNKKGGPVDYTKKSKYSETQLKKLSVVEYLNHPSLKKTSLGINAGDIAYVGQLAALDLEKRKIAKIISNRLETK